MTKKEFMLDLKKRGWGKLDKPLYPNPCLRDYLATFHKEILDEFKDQYDKYGRSK